MIVGLEAKEGNFECLLELARVRARRSMNEEAGCLGFEILKPRGASDQLRFIERYADRAALDHHPGTERLAKFRETMPPLVSPRAITFRGAEGVLGGIFLRACSGKSIAGARAV